MVQSINVGGVNYKRQRLRRRVKVEVTPGLALWGSLRRRAGESLGAGSLGHGSRVTAVAAPSR